MTLPRRHIAVILELFILPRTVARLAQAAKNKNDRLLPLRDTNQIFNPPTTFS